MTVLKSVMTMEEALEATAAKHAELAELAALNAQHHNEEREKAMTVIEDLALPAYFRETLNTYLPEWLEPNVFDLSSAGSAWLFGLKFQVWRGSEVTGAVESNMRWRLVDGAVEPMYTNPQWNAELANGERCIGFHSFLDALYFITSGGIR